jgi:hypothetical protein
MKLMLSALLAVLTLSQNVQAETKKATARDKVVAVEKCLPVLDKKATGSIRPASDKTGKDLPYPPALWLSL